MNDNKVARVMVFLRDYIPNDKKLEMQGILQGATDCVETLIAGMNFKSSTIALVLSIFLWQIGVDRFYVGDVGLGLLKLFAPILLIILYLIDIFGIFGTLGLAAFEIWCFADIFLFYKRAKKKNYKDIKDALGIYD
ncbi:MAG: TM2 domain-containing protein [Faecalibacterium sp.]|nr:TM2 domain-containing protein [Faecalibacterium sp.]